MEAVLGKSGLKNTWQAPFAEEVGCIQPGCGGKARIAFVAHEIGDTHGQHVYKMHDNDPKGSGYWPHDACAVAVYLCKKCLKPTAEFNQA